HERAVVAGVVDLADAGAAVIAAARRDRRVVERTHFGAAAGAKCDVQLVGWVAYPDPEIRFAVDAKAGELRELHHDHITERRQRLGVERHTRVEIRHLNTDVIDHERDDTPWRWVGCTRAHSTGSPGCRVCRAAHRARGPQLLRLAVRHRGDAGARGRAPDLDL